jgi:V8-like Glu-specific endopeptidase
MVMIRKRLLLGASATASALGLTMMLLGPSALATAASASTRSTPQVVGVKAKVNKAAVLAYWTPARLAAAKDADVLTVAGAPTTAAVGAAHTGKRGEVPGSLPGGAKAPFTLSNGPAVPAAFTYPFPYDSWTVPNRDYTKYPWSVNGKIFFTNDGTDYVCSGTVVPSVSGSSNEDEVWTAGHCLINTESLTGVWDSSLVFIPAYNGTKSGAKQDPFGEYVWTGAAESTVAWVDNRDLSEDEAAFTVGTNSHGQTLGNVVGWAGFAWNWSTNEQFVAFGYPAASPYTGNTLITDLAASAVLDTSIGGAGSPPVGIGNPMTGGSSGGGWMVDWSDTGTGYVDGHNDYKYTSEPDAMYSPYQDSLSNIVRCFGASSC